MKSKLNKKGEIIYFDYEHFTNLFKDKDTCFICGVSNKFGVIFNDEHIIPNWILKHYKLFDNTIKLPNEQLSNYSKYKIPCCKRCNDQLSTTYEIPLSELLKSKYNNVSTILNENQEVRNKIFKWLCLIYVKSYFSKRQFRINLDNRLPNKKISEMLDPNNLHHIHCISRSHLTNAQISSNTYGTFILGLSNEPNNFDYCDDKNSSTIMMKLGDKFMIAVLDDSGAVKELLDEFLKKLQGKALNNFQIRELFTLASYTNFNLKERPEYFSAYKEYTNQYHVDVKIPKTFELIPHDEIKYSYKELLAFYIEQLLPANHPIMHKILEGKWGFLFDENGDFFDQQIF